MAYQRSFINRIKEGIKEHKATLILIGVIIGIAAVVCAVMLLAIAPSKGAFIKFKDDVETSLATLTSNYSSLEADMNNIKALGPLATAKDVEAILARVNQIQVRMLELEDAMAVLPVGLPEAHLTGSIGNYTLHTKSNKSGNFTANIHMFFTPPVSINATSYSDALAIFYNSINWAAVNVTYIPTITYDSVTWAVSKVTFNVGTFALAANTQTSIPIIFGGLNITYIPTFAYIEVYPVLR